MARRCELTGIGPQSGNNVSHSNRKTRTRFLPNLHNVSLPSEVLGTNINLRITTATLRSIEHNGGLDKFLLKKAESKLSAKGAKLKRQIKRKLAASESAAA